MGNKRNTLSFPVSTVVSLEQLAELRKKAQDAMQPERKLVLFNELMADSRKPFNERKWKRRIGSLPAMWLRDALNLPAPKKGEKPKGKGKSKGKDQCEALIWKVVEEVLSNTRRALENGSTLSIVDEMFKQTSDQIAFWAGLIGQEKTSEAEAQS
jgi:hypothetical protein